MADRPQWAPADVDLAHPSVARVYDFYLGGSHNFESDRAFAQLALEALPVMPTLARENRAFLRRAVRYLCRAGVDQFVDLGSGIPTEGNVHEVARAANPAARVVYVDHDPVAVLHSRHLLQGDDRADAVLADVRDAAGVVELAAGAGVDLDRPVAVLAIALLHFVADADAPADLMARYLAAVSAGSHLVISHSSSDCPPAMTDFAGVYARPDSPNTLWLRTRDEIAALFGDLEIVAPGVVRVPLWRAEPSDDTGPGVAVHNFGYAGVGRKP